jgi:hypothetical protein
MHKFVYSVFLFLFIGVSTQINAQQLVLYGRTISAQQAEIVQLASITNINTGKKYISNRQGYFKLFYSTNDTILITAVGYDSVYIQTSTLDPNMAKDTLLVILKSKVVRLKELRVVSSNPIRDSIARAAAEFLKNDPLMNNFNRVLNREKGGLMSPLTAMYQQFSKEGRDAARFEEFMAYMEKQKQADRKYNRNVVKRVTDLPDMQLDEFMLFCRLDKDFVINASEYDLVSAIRKCLPNFRAGRK